MQLLSYHIEEPTASFLISHGFSVNFPKRFWAKVRKTETCWLWTAATFKDGYGQVRPGGSATCIYAHRASWILHFSSIPEALWVLHTCDNPGCVNPGHLWLGTAANNTADMHAKGRNGDTAIYGEAHFNHKLTWAKVKDARARYSQGGVTQRELAKCFGVSHTAMRFCLLNRTWVG
jgi:hypothetical protein